MTARFILRTTCVAGIAIASCPSTTPASKWLISCAVALSAYVKPIPVWSAADASTNTSVVAFHSMVPSDSGKSVGIV